MTFRSIFAHREFRWLWLADVQSLLGDQLARVALSVLVFDRTGSGFATSAVYALTFLPAVFGGLVLGRVADVLPRRELLVGCDAIRAILLALMAMPAVPLGVVGALLAVAVLVGAPFKAAEAAIVAELFDSARYGTAVAVRAATGQTAQLVGFMLGGATVAALGSRPALVVDAVTFACSAAVLRGGLKSRPTAARRQGGRPGTRALTGFSQVFGDRQLRTLLGLSWLAGLWVVPEGLAVPYAAAAGAGPASVGVLLAANPTGCVIGALLLGRVVPVRWRSRLVGPLAVACGLPLLACARGPGLPVSMVLWLLSGVLSAYQVQVVAEYVAAVPNHIRGQAIGLASSGLLGVQGLGLLLGGIAAQLWTSPVAIAGAGGIGLVAAVGLASARRGYQRY